MDVVVMAMGLISSVSVCREKKCRLSHQCKLVMRCRWLGRAAYPVASVC